MLLLLNENDGELPAKTISTLVERKAKLSKESGDFKITKKGHIRWQIIFSWYVLFAVRANWIVKRKGIWYITEEGQIASKFTPEKLSNDSRSAYNATRPQNAVPTYNKQESSDGYERNETVQAIETNIEPKSPLEEAESSSFEEFKSLLISKRPYEFQDLCAALLRSMGYYTPFIAPKGKDGGIDIIAYRDPLGTQAPRIKAQVKQRAEAKVTAKEIRELVGILKANEIGVFISTSGFTSDAEWENRQHSIHIELIDIERFIELWTEYFPKMHDEDKTLMPITSVAFLDKTNELTHEKISK